MYILDDLHAGKYRMGAASRWWLHHALCALNASLGGALQVYVGDPADILLELAKTYSISAVYWNRCYEPWRIQRDTVVKNRLRAQNITVKSFNGSLLWEPWEVLKADGTPYKVFTPFYRRGCLSAKAPREPLNKPENLQLVNSAAPQTSIGQLNLLPKIRWDLQLLPHWLMGEQAAQQRLADFLTLDITDYKTGRNFPAQTHVSRLSPYLHFGELSPNQAWHAARSIKPSDHTDCFCSELGWREFSYSLLYYHPELPEKNLQTKFEHFPWREDEEALMRWQQGQTGIPIVDAGMRELWQTGYMHNRVRMIVGSFLVKNLLLPWQYGERWFWDCLVDADLANNSASWQWIAGCGADAAPYFRIFNAVTQGQKFDAEGFYTRQYVPELKALPDKYLFNPWDAPAQVLQQAGVRLGDTYPYPLVDLSASRIRALAAFQALNQTMP